MKIGLPIFLTVLMCSCNSPVTGKPGESKSPFQTIGDRLVQSKILWAVKAYQKSHFPEYIDVRPISSRIVEVWRTPTGTSNEKQDVELWTFECRNKKFIHKINIFINNTENTYIHVIADKGFPKVVDA